METTTPHTTDSHKEAMMLEHFTHWRLSEDGQTVTLLIVGKCGRCGGPVEEPNPMTLGWKQGCRIAGERRLILTRAEYPEIYPIEGEGYACERCHHWPGKPDGVRRGVHHYGEDGEACEVWAVFTRAAVRAGHLRAYMEDAPSAHYGGPGRAFCRAPSMRRSRSRVLVKQYHGLDV
jgi:hypothetical protein